MTLPIDIQYHIDSLVEVNLITEDVSYYAYYFHEGDWQWFDAAQGLEGKRDALVEKYHWWVANKATYEQRQACAAECLSGWRDHKEELISSIVDDCFATVAKKLEKNRGVKEALSPRTIKRVMRKSAHVKNALRLYRRGEGVPADRSREAMTAARIKNAQRSSKRLLAAIQEEREKAEAIAVAEAKSGAVLTRNNKAVHMLKAIAGNEAASIYLSGESVLVRGKTAIFQFTKDQETSLGHGGVETRLLDFDGNDLSGLCVYFKDTPPAEQVAGFIMMIQSGHEDEIIETGNFYGITSRGYEFPPIKNRLDWQGDRLADAFALASDGLPNIVRTIDRAVYGLPDNAMALRRKHAPALKNRVRSLLLTIPSFAKLEQCSNLLLA